MQMQKRNIVIIPHLSTSVLSYGYRKGLVGYEGKGFTKIDYDREMENEEVNMEGAKRILTKAFHEKG